ncbi:hypothetical protein EJ08DRAFT_652773, partial [Tothia fuscella]
MAVDFTKLEPSIIKSICHHVLLPPDSPQQKEDNLSDIDSLLIRLTDECVATFIPNLDEEDCGSWDAITACLAKWKMVQNDSVLEEEKLDAVIRALEPSATITLFISGQNAGVILHRPSSSKLLIEAFEAAPEDSQVVVNTGRLIRRFPNRAVLIPFSLVEEARFRKELVHALTDLCANPSALYNSGDKHQGTTDPSLVTDLLINLIAPLGEFAPSGLLVKNMREEVYCHKSKEPWRRSAMWLCIRVSLQRALMFSFPLDQHYTQYKNLMVYLFCAVLSLATDSHLHDLVPLLMTKLARRVAKLKEVFPFVKTKVSQVLKEARDLLDGSWNEAQEREKNKSLVPIPHTGLDSANLVLPLDNCRTFLAEAMDLDSLRAVSNPDAIYDNPYRLGRDTMGLPSLSATNYSEVLLLADFERWVAKCLSTWQKTVTVSGAVCDQLGCLIDNYIHNYQIAYEHCPMLISQALLVILELWIVLDKFTIELTPLLADYHPSLDPRLVVSLLLRKSEDMQRAAEVEKYLKNRMTCHSTFKGGIFAEISSTCFAVKHFDQCTRAQAHRKRAELKAEAEKEKTKNAWKTANALYESLQDKLKSLECSQDENGNHEPKSCVKCKTLRQSRSVTVKIYEHPLPADEEHIKAVFVELNLPEGFEVWRSTTWRICHDLGQTNTKKDAKPPALKLIEYDVLWERTNKTNNQLTFASETALTQRGKSTKKIPVDLEKVCIPNSAIWKLHDSDSSCWVENHNERPSFERFCSIQLPPGPYQSLQWAVDGTSHTPNEVLSRQDECPKELSLEEFLAFAEFRSGHRLHSMNILREVAAPRCKIKCLEVHILLRQAMWQFGPGSEDSLRESHFEFGDQLFCERLLGALQNLAVQISNASKLGNLYTLGFIIDVALRVLSLANGMETKSSAQGLLIYCRGLASQWVQDLERKFSEDEADAIIIFRAANLVRSTFDVDIKDLPMVLETNADMEALVDSMISAHQYQPTEGSHREMVASSAQLNRHLEHQLRKMLPHRSEGINAAVSRRLNKRPLKGNWKSALDMDNNNNSTWILNQSQHIAFNIITGELKAEGQSAVRIPDDYVTDSAYQRIFGVRVLQVLHSDLDSMKYMAAEPINGHELHLVQTKKQVLIITKRDGKTHRLLPSDTFRADLPHQFSSDYCHWLDIDSGEVEFRPIGSPFESSRSSWWLKKPYSDYFLSRPDSCLIPRHGALWQHLFLIFLVFEKEEHILITKDDKHVIHIRLPRFNLDFSVNPQGAVECPKLDAVILAQQSVGTLIGLENKIVLQSQNSTSRLKISVLVPYGHVSLERNSGAHPDVSIDIEKHGAGEYFQYFLDPDLKRIKGPGDILSTMFLGYLHGATSSTLPDPFTGVTGTDEGLRILNSASLHKSSPLTDRELQLLACLARHLSPRITQSKGQLPGVPEVIWNASLSPLVQVDGFYRAAYAIKKSADRFAKLYKEEHNAKEILPLTNLELQLRARHRNAWTSNSETLDPGQDFDYSNRDAGHTGQGSQVFRLSELIARKPTKMKVSQMLFEDMVQWSLVQGFQKPFVARSFNYLLTSPINEQWGSLFHSARDWTKDDIYHVLFVLGPMAYRPDGKGKDGNRTIEGSSDDIDFHSHLRTFLIIVLSGKLRDYPLPSRNTFNLGGGLEAPEDELTATIARHVKPLQDRPSAKLSSRNRSKNLADVQSEEQKKIKDQSEKLKRAYLNKWPAQKPQIPAQKSYTMLNISAALKSCQQVWDEVQHNLELMKYMKRLQVVVNRMNEDDETGEPPEIDSSIKLIAPVRNFRYPSLADFLVGKTDAKAGLEEPSIKMTGRGPQIESDRLEEFVCHFAEQNNLTKRSYGKSLASSLDAFKKLAITECTNRESPTKDLLERHLSTMKNQLHTTFSMITSQLMPRTDQEKVLESAGLWFPVTPQKLLSTFHNVSWNEVEATWKTLLITYGNCLANYQRAERLLRLFNEGYPSRFYEELSHTSQENWNARGTREWLLFEIENDITIRPEQAEVAFELLTPESGKNTVVQLGMGKGKSAVIIPMLALAIADGNSLVRILTLKELLPQTARLLSQRLGGIVNRSVYHLPFSRKTAVDKDFLLHLADIHDDIVAQGNILIALPEEVLAFRLCMQQKIVSDPQLAGKMLRAEHHLADVTRDIIDESDEVLSPRFSLIHTMGAPQSVEANPHRWNLAMEVLEIFSIHAQTLRINHPARIDLVKKCPGAYPVMRFLDSDTFDDLSSQVVDDIKSNKVTGVPLHFVSSDFRVTVAEYIRNGTISKHFSENVIAGLESAPHILQAVHILRGYFAYDVLGFAMKDKRYAVSYGLDLQRSNLAVPYRAKDTPTTSAEFAHVDCALILTCLSYYYSGLTEGQLRTCFESLFKEPDAEEEFSVWYNWHGNMPRRFQFLDSIDLNANETFTTDILPLLAYNTKVINFYLRKIVFPGHANEYTEKLACSAWDIPSTNELLTTGFSGTNDFRSLLPLGTEQRDIPTQQHTNTLVLDLILQKANQEYIPAIDVHGAALASEDLLKLVVSQEPRISVLTDVGAQILDLRNHEVAASWLKLVPWAIGVVYFDDTHEPLVLSRDKRITSLHLSPCRLRMGEVLVFLDECHTRGVDLPIYSGARAALTLCTQLNKDKLTQAALRLRQLGSGQSICFFGPPEVHAILLNDQTGETIDSFDVLRFTMEETCREMDRLRSLWILNGINYCHRSLLLDQFMASPKGLEERSRDEPHHIKFLAAITEPDNGRLSDIYGAVSDVSDVPNKLKGIRKHEYHRRLSEAWKTIDTRLVGKANLSTEQEREMAVELQVELYVESPPMAVPYDHANNVEVEHYVKTGLVSTTRSRRSADTTIQGAFETFRRTSMERTLTIPINWSDELLASQDFILTVEIPTSGVRDSFLRSVLWVLESITAKTLMVISGYEANKFLPQIRESENVRLHIFSPRVSSAGQDLATLKFFSISGQSTTSLEEQPLDPKIIEQLNLFAGSLYLNDLNSYKQLCDFLGLITTTPPYNSHEEFSIGSDGFANEFARQAMTWAHPCPFKVSPIPFIKAVLSMRMRGQSFDRTHLGMILSGRRLADHHFEALKAMKRKVIEQGDVSIKRQKSENLFVGEEDSDGDSEMDALMEL